MNMADFFDNYSLTVTFYYVLFLFSSSSFNQIEEVTALLT